MSLEQKKLAELNEQPGSVLLESVSKSFRKNTQSSPNGKRAYSTLKSSFLGRFSGAEAGQATKALSELTIIVEPGQAIGVLGRNGSGKSTLLKLIAGIYRPDSGSVQVNGRVSALIELGAGFHPDFTGRENIYLGGIMFGMSRKEIDSHFDDIVNFAELQDFIDDPVRTYSSGMYMRLGFSLAIHTDPDILLVDEVLAVGDAAFIHRCHDRISDLKRRGKTLIFVTHDLDSVKRWCDEAIWLNRGVVQARGEPRQVIDQYLQSIEESEEKKLEAENNAIAEIIEEKPNLSEEELTRWGSGEVEISDVRFIRNGDEQWLVHSGEEISVEFSYRAKSKVQELVFGIGILRADGLTVFGTNTDIEGVKVSCPVSLQGTVKVILPKLELLEGSYYLDVAAHKSDGTPYDYHHRRYKFSVRNPIRYHGVYVPEHRWEIR